MKNILLAKEMPLYSKKFIAWQSACAQRFRVQNSLSHIDFCSRIIKHYLEFSGYDELIANMIFLDMYKNGSNINNSIESVHYKEVLFFQSVLVSQPANPLTEKMGLFQSVQGRCIYLVIRQESQYQSDMINHAIEYINRYQGEQIRQIQKRKNTYQSMQINHGIKHTKLYQSRLLSHVIQQENLIQQKKQIWAEHPIEQKNQIQPKDYTQTENHIRANTIAGIYKNSRMIQNCIQNRIINQLLKKEYKIPDTRRQNQVRIQKTKENISTQGELKSREVFWNCAVCLKHIFQNQLVNLLTEKKELLQENTANFVTDKKSQYQDNQYQDNQIKHIIGYANRYQGEQIRQIQERRIVYQSIQKNHVIEYTEKYQNTLIKYINITQIEGQSGTYWDNWINFSTRSENLHQVNPISYIEKQKSLHQVMQSRLLFHVIQQKNRIQTKNYTQTGNHVQANTIAGLYQKSSKIQNRIINQLHEEKNEILNKRQNQVRIQRTEKNILVQEWIQKIEKNISVQEQIQKIEKNVSIQEGIESREAYWNSAVFLKNIFQMQLANPSMEKKKLLQDNTVNFVTNKKIQYQDNKYQDNQIKHIIGYANWYQGEQVRQRQERRIVYQSIQRNYVIEYTEKYRNTSPKYINITQIEGQSGTYWDNWINFSTRSENLHQVNPISYIEKQKSLHQVMQSRLLFHVIQQKNRIQTKNYTQTGNHVQENTIAGLYKKSSTIQNCIINQLHEEKNEILDKRQNQVWIQRTEKNILVQEWIQKIEKNISVQEQIQKIEKNVSIQEGIESREAYWNSAVFLKNIFQMQLANPSMEKKKLLQDNAVNFVTNKKIQYQDNHYKGNKIKHIIGYANWYQGEQIKQIQERRIVHQSIQRKHVIEYTEKYQSIPIKYINITQIEGQSGTYWDNWINFSTKSENLHQVNPINNIEKQKNLHQTMQSSMIQNRIINQLLEKENRISDVRQNYVRIQETEEKELLQEDTVNFATAEKIQYQGNKIKHIIGYTNWYQRELVKQIQARRNMHQVNLINAKSITFRKDFYKNNAIMSIPGDAFDLWGINQTALKTATGLEQTVEKENYYSSDRIYAEKSNINEKILSKVQCQIGDAIEKSQEDLAGERRKSADREKILKILEERVQQKEEQIKELKIMCKAFYKQQEEDKDNQVRKEKYLEVFNNDWKLERMRYGVL